MTADLIEVVMATITHDGNAMGLVKGLAAQQLFQDLEISNQGSLGADAIPTVSKRQNVTLTYLGGPPVVADAFGDIEIEFTTAGGTSYFHVFKNMLAKGYTFSHNEHAEAVYTQEFKNKSDFSTSQHTQTD